MKSAAFPLADLEAANRASSGRFHVFLDIASMSVELFELRAGSLDTQKPHLWDELYYVISGRAALTVEDERYAVEPNGSYFVAAGVDHRFVEIEEDLKIIVFFSKKV